MHELKHHVKMPSVCSGYSLKFIIHLINVIGSIDRIMNMLVIYILCADNTDCNGSVTMWILMYGSSL